MKSLMKYGDSLQLVSLFLVSSQCGYAKVESMVKNNNRDENEPMTTPHELTGQADIHMHTNASDGLPTAKQVLDSVAKREHLDVIAITDHDVLEASLWAYEQRSKYAFDIIPGVEVTACNGHVLGL
jgi:DNA polymerase III alpha subunit (gram-positive type)